MDEYQDRRICNRLDDIKIVNVIEVLLERGLGTEKDPSRWVKQYWDLDGNFMFEKDPLKQ